jgi:hypothetical protein
LALIAGVVLLTGAKPYWPFIVVHCHTHENRSNVASRHRITISHCAQVH